MIKLYKTSFFSFKLLKEIKRFKHEMCRMFTAFLVLIPTLFLMASSTLQRFHFVIYSVIRAHSPSKAHHTRLHSEYVSFFTTWIFNSCDNVCGDTSTFSSCYLIEGFWCLGFIWSNRTKVWSKVNGDKSCCTFEELPFIIKESREPESPSERKG